MNLDKNYIEKLLWKLFNQNRRYRASKKRSAFFDTDFLKTFYETSGALDKYGMPYSVEELQEKYGSRFEAKIRQFEKITQKGFIGEQEKKLQSSVVKMLYDMGDEEEAEHVAGLSNRRFMELWYQKKYIDVVFKYREEKEEEIASLVAGEMSGEARSIYE